MITFLSILGILALLGVVASLAAMLNDGYRPVPTDWSRVHERRDDPAVDELARGTDPVPSHAAGTVPRRAAARRAARRARVNARR